MDAEGEVKIEDVINQYVIFSDKASYKRDKEIVFAEGNAKAIDDENRTLTADKIIYNKLTNIVDAEGEVKIEDVIEDYQISSKNDLL